LIGINGRTKYGFVRICPEPVLDPSAELTESQSAALAAKIREELARRRISRQRLADDARISISTLEKALNGSRPFTLATLVRLESALGISLRPAPPAEEHAAAPELGGYARAGAAWLEGDYLTLRPSFEVEGAIFAYRTRIGWDEKAGALVFHEADRIDAPFAQKGVVSLPSKSGHIYLRTNEQGQMRLAVLGRPQITGEIYGLLTTLQSGKGTQLTPVSVPLALVPLKGSPAMGRILPGETAADAYRRHLDRVISGGFARILTA
jgi:transcriptional regulator with XRE-family HTH domain